MTLQNREHFVKFAAQPEEQLDWLEGAVLIAQAVYPEVRLQECRQQLDVLADEVQRGLQENIAPPAAEDVARELYGRCRLSGNTKSYYDANNSCINWVLEHRMGIPISLALVFVEVAQRLGIQAEGINFPGHFLVRCGGFGGALFDPFSGKGMGPDECESLLQRMQGMQATLEPSHLQVIGVRKALRRMLTNLKVCSMNVNDYLTALFCVDRMLLLQPEVPMDLRERGYLYYRLECFPEAAEDIGRFLEAMPEHVTAPSFRKLRDWLLEQHEPPVN
jgi:regulator of sirC expression with transglutaminase-like and TPR domain